MTYSSPPSSTRGIDRARLESIIDPVARAHGAEVVDFEWKSEPGGWVLRVYVEKMGSADANLPTEKATVDLDLCTRVARDLSPALDVADLVDHRYHLEVSTPGVERPLRHLRDYARFAGKKAKLKLRVAVAGQKVVTGVIGQAADEAVRIVVDGRPFDIALSDIASAHLVFEFGPAPKPGKKK
jgi:ribosome maturation factor RimP